MSFDCRLSPDTTTAFVSNLAQLIDDSSVRLTLRGPTAPPAQALGTARSFSA